MYGKKQPVIVLFQVPKKNRTDKVKYRLLGLGIIDNFIHEKNVFEVINIKYDNFKNLGRKDVMFEEAKIRTSAFDKFQLFEEEKATYVVSSSVKRERAFRNVVLDSYDYTCAVTGLKFFSESHVEAQAAHIVSKSKKGTDHICNGIALSGSVHWAFDIGAFTISDQYEVILNPKVKHANIKDFLLFNLDRKPIIVPEDDKFLPHPDALNWHKEEVFNKFKL